MTEYGKPIVFCLLCILAFAAVAEESAIATSPIPNTTRDKDGVIRLNPTNGCGPNAHVETHPKHGQLCIQNGGTWKKTTPATAKANDQPCIGPNGSNVAPDGSLWQCRRGPDGSPIVATSRTNNP